MTHTAIYGAAGFVGTTLLTRGTLDGGRLTLIDPAPLDADAPGADVLRTTSLAELGDADTLLVLAGQTDVDQALADPALAFVANNAIAVEVGSWWRRHPAARVVYLSSDEVLGVSGVPLREDAPYRPTQPYAASKASAEMTLRCYQETYGLDLVVVRSCNLVGGRQRARKLIPTAVRQLALGLPVPVYGTGDHVREYLAVEDLCVALEMAMDRRLPGGVYHCSSGIALPILEVIRIVAGALGMPARLEHGEHRLVHDRAYAMNAGLLQSHGWRARVPPPAAIAAAAVELLAAWRGGESLTERVVPHPLRT